MRIVVCTIVHHPADARIYYRQIRALLNAGHEVRYIAPVGPQDFRAERTGPSLHLPTGPRALGKTRGRGDPRRPFGPGRARGRRGPDADPRPRTTPGTAAAAQAAAG